MIWNLYDHIWKEGISHTIEFKKTNLDDPNCEYKYRSPDGFNLGGWQSRQRKLYKKIGGSLTDKQKNELEALGFIFDPLQKQWDEMFDSVYEHYKTHGNVTFSHRHFFDILGSLKAPSLTSTLRQEISI